MRYLKVDLVPTLGVLGQRVVGEEHVLVTCLTSAKCFVFFPSSAFSFFFEAGVENNSSRLYYYFFIHLLVICEPDIVHGGGTALEVLVVLAQVVLQSVVGHNFLTQPTPPYGYSKVKLNLIKYSREIIFDISNGGRE